ncbi:unnamed protein product [Closterium sp. NIES-54]
MSRGIMGFIDGIPGNLNNMSIPSMGSDVDPFKVAAGLAVAVGVAAIGGVAAAVTVGGIIVLREQYVSCLSRIYSATLACFSTISASLKYT